MILWIELQEAAVIGALVCALCYAIAAVAFVISRLLARHSLAPDLKTLTPVLLTPLSVIAGLLIAFLASRVWANLDHANGYVIQEVAALQDLNVFASVLPPGPQDAAKAGLTAHLRFVEAQDWPAMLAGRATVQHSSPGLDAALASLLAFEPATIGQREVQSWAITAAERALEARRGRILLSNAVIAPSQWIVILVLDGLILLTLGVVHIDRTAAAATGMLIFSTAIAASLVLLMINDRPFSAGGNVLQPTALRQVVIQ